MKENKKKKRKQRNKQKRKKMMMILNGKQIKKTILGYAWLNTFVAYLSVRICVGIVPDLDSGAVSQGFVD